MIGANLGNGLLAGFAVRVVDRAGQGIRRRLSEQRQWITARRQLRPASGVARVPDCRRTDRGHRVQPAVGAAQGGLLHVGRRRRAQVVGGLAAQCARPAGTARRACGRSARRRTGSATAPGRSTSAAGTPPCTNHEPSISNAVANSSLTSSGIRSIGHSDPSKYFRSAIITSSHRPRSLELADQVLVDHGEVAAHVGLHEQVAVGRLDGLGDADDVGDRRGRRDRHHVRVAHALPNYLAAQGVPIQPLGAVLVEVAAAVRQRRISTESIGRMPRLHSDPSNDAYRPRSTARSRRRLDGEVGQLLHRGVGELDRRVRCVGHAQRVQRVGESHQPQPDRAVREVRPAGRRDRVQVDVDDVVEHPHRRA